MSVMSKAAILLALAASACSHTPPSGWATGGQPVVMPQARWVNGELLVDLSPDGQVFVGGQHLFTIDPSGRVYDAAHEPIALLQRDGMLFGTGDRPMGWVGAGEAILPGDEHSWLVLLPSGLLVRSDGEEEKPFGQWLGCSYQHTVQACMLVSHIVGQELMAKQGQGQSTGLLGPGLSVGVGAGFIGP